MVCQRQPLPSQPQPVPSSGWLLSVFGTRGTPRPRRLARFTTYFAGLMDYNGGVGQYRQ